MSFASLCNVWYYTDNLPGWGLHRTVCTPHYCWWTKQDLRLSMPLYGNANIMHNSTNYASLHFKSRRQIQFRKSFFSPYFFSPLIMNKTESHSPFLNFLLLLCKNNPKLHSNYIWQLFHRNKWRPCHSPDSLWNLTRSFFTSPGTFRPTLKLLESEVTEVTRFHNKSTKDENIKTSLY